MFILTLSQSKQVLMRESKFVRKAVIQYIEKLELELNKPMTVEELIILQAENIKSVKGRMDIFIFEVFLIAFGVIFPFSKSLKKTLIFQLTPNIFSIPP